jgi:putative oxidoreductase
MSTSPLLDRVLSTDGALAPLLLRVPVGAIFAAHGAQKLFGWFGGHGLAGTAQFFASIGLNPGGPLALAAGGVEFFGGLALMLGLLVRPSAIALAFTMAVAIVSVHLDKGFFAAAGGYEYALALAAASLALVASGGGRASVDGALAARGTGARLAGGAPAYGVR